MFKDTNNILKNNLEQGKDILQYNKDVTTIEEQNLPLVEKGSIIESMDNIKILDTDRKQLEGLTNIDDEYNNLLTEYNQTYKQVNEEILDNSQTKKLIVNYLGKVISDEDGNNYYVNNFGYTHKYNSNAWEHNNSSCPSDKVDYTGNFDNFNIGMPMIPGQPCKIAGQNVKNKKTGEESWVDIKGIKHPFSSDKKSESCSTRAISLNDTDYNLIPTGAAMGKTDNCLTLDVNPQLYDKLEKLKNKIKKKSEVYIGEINSLNISNVEIQQELAMKKRKITKYVNDVSKLNKNIIYSNRMLAQVSGNEEDASLRMTSNLYWYIIWIFLAIFIISITLTNTSGVGGKKISGISYVIIAIFILMFLIYVYNKMTIG